MYCRHCYQQIEDGSEKCPLCGWPQKQVRIALDDLEAEKVAEKHIDKETTIDELYSPRIDPDLALPTAEPDQSKNARGSEYMYCRKCGTKISVDSSFCSSCGAKTSADIKPTVKTETSTKTATCPHCHGHNIQYHTVTEDRESGCGTGCLYLFLALTILGIFILIPLMLRKNTEASTYAICQDCGNRWKV